MSAAPADGAPIASGRGTARQLWLMQRLAEGTVVVSMTRKCPLSCRHCITSSSPDAPGPVMSRALAARLAADFPAMAREGLHSLSLTGGEPILAMAAVALLVRAAAAAGIAPYIVTSAAWATTPEVAARVVARAGPVAGWDIGADAWHAEEMPLSRLENALAAIAPTGARAVVRVCDPPDPAQAAGMEAALRRAVAGRAEILRQSVRRLGRAAGIAGADAAAAAPGLPRRPCPSSGLFVRADASTGPCCAGLAYAGQGRHPLDFGGLEAGGLAAAWRAWRTDPLLRTMRLATLAALEGWLPAAEQGRAAPSDPCEACVALWSRLAPDAAAALRDRAATAPVRARLRQLEEVLDARVAEGV